MTVREIITDEAMLRRKSDPVTKWDDALTELIDDLFDTLYDAGGRGLSAPQVGVLSRVFVMDKGWKEGEREPVAFINPELLSQQWPMVVEEEACLSIPGRAFRVARPMVAEVRWTTPNGAQTVQKLWSTEARIACHEIDHFNGKLITDIGDEV